MSEDKFLSQENYLIFECQKIISQAQEEGIILRALGAVGFRIHCPHFKYLEYAAGRYLSDLDFATYSSQLKGVEKVFIKCGFIQNEMIKTLHGNQRRIFDHPETGLHADVFVDKLRFCHDVSFLKRLEADFPTIPLAELLLEKLQIVKFENKDAIDSIILLREHEIGDTDKEIINASIISKTLSNDWGFWKTVQLNLGKLEDFVKKAEILNAFDKKIILERLNFLRERIDKEPKTLAWKLRARVGEKRQWFREVEEIERD